VHVSRPCSALLRHWVGLLYGLIAILGITPCLGFGMLALPLQPPEFATGLALFCVVPTTLGVGVALTAASKGNQALALLLTVASNLLGIVTVGGRGRHSCAPQLVQ
jgi:sodium/bile acid cotransporter 7